MKKGDLPQQGMRLPGKRVVVGLATPKQTWPVVRVGADRRYETADATPEQPVSAGVRAPLVAWQPVNAGGAKGCRKVETR